MKEKILITGASGFIGSYCIDEALKRNLTPICFDRYNHEYPEGCETFKGDIRDSESIQEAVAKVDYALNLAGILGTQETIGNPIPSVQTNLIGCINFLNACRPTKFHKIRGVEIVTGNHWMDNSYAITKSAARRCCMMYNKEHDTKIALVRGYNAYGPKQKHKPVRKIVPIFIVKALRGEDIEIYGDGSQIGDMIAVWDLAKILVDACVKDHGIYNQVFEAGTGRRTSVNFVAEQIIKACNSNSQLKHLPMRPGEKKNAVVLANPDTLKPLGDYELTPFEDGIIETVAWYNEYYDWK